MGPKLAKKPVNMESKSEPFLDYFFPDLGVSSGSISGTILESKWAKKRQHGPKKGPQGPQRTEKQHLQNRWFYNRKTIFFESWGLSRRA